MAQIRCPKSPGSLVSHRRFQSTIEHIARWIAWRSALFQLEHPVRPEEVRAALDRVAEMFPLYPPPKPEPAPKPPKPKGTVIPLTGAKDNAGGGRGKEEG